MVTQSSSDTPTEAPPLIGARTTLGLVVLAIVLVLATLLVIQNFQTIRVRLFGAEVEMRLGWALLIAGAVGVGVRALLGRLIIWR